MEPFEAYTTYMALKRHFNSDYDYIKYNGKVNIKYDNFLKRKDIFFYKKLAKKQDVKGIVISNILESNNGDIWVKDILTEESETKYLKWKKRIESLTYHFKSDINKLNEDFDSNLHVKNNQYPYLLKLYINGEISIETLIIIDSMTNVFNYWNKNIVDPILWPNIYKKCIKYKPFLNFDITKLKQIVVDKFKNT